MSALDEALKHLRRMAKKLLPDQGRIARRNARRKVCGALRRVRLALDMDFPPVPKERPEKKGKEKQEKQPPPEKLRLPFRRAWEKRAAVLFAEVVCAVHRCALVPSVFMSKKLDGLFTADASRGQPSRIFISGQKTDGQNWLTLIAALAEFLNNQKGMVLNRDHAVRDLWAQFWKEPIPHEDVELVARHQAFLESIR